MIFVTLNLFLCFSFLIKAANDDYLAIKSRTEQQRENYYRVPHGLLQIEKDYTHHEVSPGVWHRIDKNSYFVIDSWSDDQNTFSIEFFPLLQKYKLKKDGDFFHAFFLLPKEQIQAFKVVLCPLSKGLFKKSITKGLHFNKKDGPKEFYKETVEKDVFQSEYWNQAIVESIQYLDSIKCSNDDATNAFRLLDFLQGSFAIKQVLINYLYDKDLIDDVIEGDNEIKKDFLKEYLLTNHLFHIVNRYEKFPTFYSLSCKELRFFNCENITLPKKLKSEDIELPEDIFIKIYTIKFSANKIKEIDIADIIQSFDSRLKIIFDFRNNPLNNKTKQNINASSRKRYYYELSEKKIFMSYTDFIRSKQYEEYKEDQILINQLEKQIKILEIKASNKIKAFNKKETSLLLLNRQNNFEERSKERVLFYKKIIEKWQLFLLSFLLYNQEFIFIIPFCICFLVYKFIDIYYQKISLDLQKKQNEKQEKQKNEKQNEILKNKEHLILFEQELSGVKQNLVQLKQKWNKILAKEALNHYNKKKNCNYESYLINNSFYILFDK